MDYRINLDYRLVLLGNFSLGSEKMPKVWLVTGANSGLGRAIVTAAAATGDVVVAAARRPESVGDLPAEVIRLDVTDPARINEAVAEVVARHGASTSS